MEEIKDITWYKQKAKDIKSEVEEIINMQSEKFKNRSLATKIMEQIWHNIRYNAIDSDYANIK